MCKHNVIWWQPEDYQVLVCRTCDETLGFICMACGGEGWVVESDYRCDWINYGNDWITCPDCGGSGVIYTEAHREAAASEPAYNPHDMEAHSYIESEDELGFPRWRPKSDPGEV